MYVLYFLLACTREVRAVKFYVACGQQSAVSKNNKCLVFDDNRKNKT